jgi:hypothetical protein
MDLLDNLILLTMDNKMSITHQLNSINSLWYNNNIKINSLEEDQLREIKI